MWWQGIGWTVLFLGVALVVSAMAIGAVRLAKREDKLRGYDDASD